MADTQSDSASAEHLDLTQHEIEALKYTYNLADAHTHQAQSPSQQRIVERLPLIWYEAERSLQYDIEQRFIREFFRVQKQPWALRNNNAMLVYAASIAMAIVANYLMKKNMSISLLEPCFDNIHDLLGHMKVPMEPLREEWLHDSDTLYDNLSAHVTADALFLVDPNNPTGFTLFRQGRRSYEELIRYAKDHSKLLIIDYCFASFMLPDRDLDVFDVYEMLEQSGVDYIAMEDTGKTWPVQDAKCAIIKTSKNLTEDIRNIQTSYLLNVSPFILSFLTEYILDSERDQFASVYELLGRNRDSAKRFLDGSMLEYQEPDCDVSVAWFKIRDSSIRATDLQKAILQEGVYVLPGTYFYWCEPERGDHFIRIALARNADIFEQALRLIRKGFDRYAREHPASSYLL